MRVVRLTNEAGEQNLPPFTAEEREKNLQALQFIAAETKCAGAAVPVGNLDPRLRSGLTARTRITVSKA